MSHNANGKARITEPRPSPLGPKIPSDPTQKDSLKNNDPPGEIIVKVTAAPSPRRIMAPPLTKVDRAKDKKKKKMKRNKIIGERRKAREIYREALHNTRDTITLVAVLISSFSFSAGVSPPGGVYQDGSLIGTAVAAKRTAFKVFSVCNNIALFTSLCVVLILVSIIPFKRKSLMRMLTISHKVIWVAVSFMATAYVAAEVVIIRPPSPNLPRSLDWMTIFLMSICAGSLGSVFVGLGVLLVKHRVIKRKWRNENEIHWMSSRSMARAETRDVFYTSSDEEDDDDDSSIISDMAISRDSGYHSF